MFIGVNNKGVVIKTKEDQDKIVKALNHMYYELDYINKSTSILLRDCKFDDFTRNRIEMLNSSSQEGQKWFRVATKVIDN